MKKNILITLSLIITFCSFTAIKIIKSEIKDSKIVWKGYKVGGEHDGTVELKSGFLNLKNGKEVLGGKFIIDMNTINTTDLNGSWKEKLDKHLKGEDFFDIKKYSTTTLIFKKVTKISTMKFKSKYGGEKKTEILGHTYEIQADLKIKDITKPITFGLSQDNNNFSANLKINRAEYGIKYKSPSFFENLQEKLIKDEFDVEINFSI